MCHSVNALLFHFCEGVKFFYIHVVYIQSSKVLSSQHSTAVMDAQQKREARLSRRRERERRVRASESAEQRKVRLAKRRVRNSVRCAAQSTVQRERALHITILYYSYGHSTALY